MAYLEFNERASSMAAFSPLEWAVIELSRNDSLASLSRPGALARLISALFRTGVRQPLASSRLEALRRIAVRAWHTLVRDDDLVEFERVGYTPAQTQLLLQAISARRKNGSIFS